MRMKSFWHLSPEAIKELYEVGIYDTKKYRYIQDKCDSKIYRIEKSLLGTTATLDPENWIEQ